MFKLGDQKALGNFAQPLHAFIPQPEGEKPVCRAGNNIAHGIENAPAYRQTQASCIGSSALRAAEMTVEYIKALRSGIAAGNTAGKIRHKASNAGRSQFKYSFHLCLG